MQLSFARAVVLSFAVSLVAVAGCDRGPRIVPVSGQVLIDGQPVTTGFVQFVPTGERPAYGEIGKDGRFTLTTSKDNDGAVVGTHQVEVRAWEHPTETSKKYLVPKKYGDLSTSELTVEITEPTDDLKVNLTWDGGEPFVEESQNQGDRPP